MNRDRILADYGGTYDEFMRNEVIHPYLDGLREDGCTFTETGRLTNDPDVPIEVFHDGETCPIHEV